MKWANNIIILLSMWKLSFIFILYAQSSLFFIIYGINFIFTSKLNRREQDKY